MERQMEEEFNRRRRRVRYIFDILESKERRFDHNQEKDVYRMYYNSQTGRPNTIGGFRRTLSIDGMSVDDKSERDNKR